MANKEASLLLRIKQVGADAIDKVAAGLDALKEKSVIAFGAISALVVASVKAYGEQEKATNSLNQTLVQQGIYTKELSKNYQGLASELQKKSVFADEEIVQAQSTLQSYLGQTKVTKELLKSTLDLAAAKGIDLHSASEMVGKSIGTNTNALGRQGIQLSDNATKAEKLAEVTDKLTSRFGGQAEAQTQGLGSLKVMSNQMGEILELIGEKLSPAIIALTKYFTEFTFSIQQNQNSMDGLVSISKLMIKGLIIGFSEVVQIASGLGAMFGTLMGAMSQAVQGQFKMAWETLRSGNEAANQEAIQRAEKTTETLKQIDESFAEHKKAQDVADLDRIKQSNANKQKASEEQRLIDQEIDLARKEEDKIIEDEYQMGLRDLILKRQMETLSTLLANEKNHEVQKKLIRDKTELESKIRAEGERKRELELSLYKMNLAKQVGDNAKSLADNLVVLTKGTSQELLIVQKALGIALIIINTQIAAMRAMAELGPVVGAIAAGLIYATGATSVAIASSTHLADGGIVKSTPGGIQATIGEGGKDEAVIPLDEGMGLLGTNITINVNGGMLGDENSARELAIAIDRQLLKLRQSNDSLAFDSGVI